MLVIFIPLFAAIFLPGNSGENRFGRCHPEDQRLAKLWGAFRAFDESRKRSGQTFLFTAPYFALRLAISFLLEVIGLSLVWSIRMITLHPARHLPRDPPSGPLAWGAAFKADPLENR